jgi:hypothetical protein
MSICCIHPQDLRGCENLKTDSVVKTVAEAIAFWESSLAQFPFWRSDLFFEQYRYFGKLWKVLKFCEDRNIVKFTFSWRGVPYTTYIRHIYIYMYMYTQPEKKKLFNFPLPQDCCVAGPGLGAAAKLAIRLWMWPGSEIGTIVEWDLYGFISLCH